LNKKQADGFIGGVKGRKKYAGGVGRGGHNNGGKIRVYFLIQRDTIESK